MKIIYLILTYLAHPFLSLILKFRVKKKKEDKYRYKEKLGISNIVNTNNVIWFHVASLGEIKSILPVVKHYQQDNDLKILITSVTLSSYFFFKENLQSKNTIHQFAPLDSPIIISKFLKRWRPKVSIFIESEIWPNMIMQTCKVSKLILLNCRISINSFKRWRLFKKTFQNLIKKFDYITVQNQETLKFLEYFEIKNIKYFGNLKFIQHKKHNKNNLNISNINNSWCAMSIHFDEIDYIIQAHKVLFSNSNISSTFLIPRHLNKISEIEEKILSENINLQKTSENKIINNFNGIILVDEFGLADEVFNFTNFVFMGGSFIKHGGQNPIEPLRYGCNILYGKYIFNFTEIYNELNQKKLATLVEEPDQLYKKISKLMDNKMNVNSNLYIKEYSDEIYKNTINFLNQQILI